MSKRSLVLSAALIAGVALGAAACDKKMNQAPPASSTAPAPEAAADGGSAAGTPAATAAPADPNANAGPTGEAAAAPGPAGGGTEVTLCDGKTTTTVPAGVAIDTGVAKSIASTLMAKWQAEHPDVDWEADERASRTFVPAHDNSDLIGEATQAEGHTYRNVTELDTLLWKRETEKAVVAGSRVFHSGDELGGTIAVSCDMCHPNAANTHPETYPKYQTQLGRVALLRDMINWCLVHPVRAEALSADDPKMRALEAYIISQRAGKTLAYGKH